MICPKCGHEISAGAPCPYCGHTVKLYSSNPAVNVLKSVGASPKFLVATIAYSLMVVLSLFSMSSVVQGLNNVLVEVFGARAEGLVQSISGFTVAGGVVGILLNVLIGLGMWITFVSCSNTKTGNVSTTGITICRTLLVINLVCTCILTVFAVGFFAILGAGIVEAANELMENTGVPSVSAGAPIAVICGVLLVVILLVIFYEAGAVKALTRIRKTARTGVADNRISRYFMVLTLLQGVFRCIYGVADLFSDPLDGIGQVLSGVAAFFVALCLFGYCKQMTPLRFGTGVPTAPQPPQA